MIVPFGIGNDCENALAGATFELSGNGIVPISVTTSENGYMEIKGLKSVIKRVRVVGTGEELSWKRYNDIDWSATPGVYYIDVPASALDSRMTVLAIELDGPATLYEGAGQVISFNE